MTLVASIGIAMWVMGIETILHHCCSCHVSLVPLLRGGGMVAPCAPAACSVRREKLRKCHVVGEVLNALPIKGGLTLDEYANFKNSAT